MQPSAKRRWPGGIRLAALDLILDANVIGDCSHCYFLFGVFLVGTQFSDDDLVHSVLHLEQMLTTGGGWQDQVRHPSNCCQLFVTRPSVRNLHL